MGFYPEVEDLNMHVILRKRALLYRDLESGFAENEICSKEAFLTAGLLEVRP